MTRRIVSVLIIVAVLAAAWSGGWYWAAGWAERKFPGWLAEAAEEGIDVDCSNPKVVGFPFALRIACGETRVAERETSTRALVGGAKGGISMLSPITAEVALTSPARVETPSLQGPADIRWSEAEIGLGLGMSGPRAVSFDTDDLTAEFAPIDLSKTVVAAAQAGGAFAPSDSGGTDAELTFTDLTISATDFSVPALTGSMAGHISVPPRLLLEGAGLQGPLAINDIDIALASSGARLQATGDLAIDAEGIMDGTITLRVAGAQALPEVIAALPPEQQQIGNAIAGALFALGRPAEIDGEPASEINVAIERGVAKIGFLEVGLPPLSF
jgi:hypothetical protein